MRNLLFFFLSFLICQPLYAGEITSLFITPRASKVGDTLTVIISEFSNASQSAKTDFAKDTKTEAEVEFAENVPALGWNYSSGYKGSGLTQRKGSLNAKLTAEVVEVLPNGNLRIKGEKVVRINQEMQIIHLEGVVRPQDIGPNNTILSTKIAKANITYDGKGPVSEGGKAGIISRLLGWLRIF